MNPNWTKLYLNLIQHVSDHSLGYMRTQDCHTRQTDENKTRLSLVVIQAGSRSDKVAAFLWHFWGIPWRQSCTTEREAWGEWDLTGPTLYVHVKGRQKERGRKTWVRERPYGDSAQRGLLGPCDLVHQADTRLRFCSSPVWFTGRERTTACEEKQDCGQWRKQVTNREVE